MKAIKIITLCIMSVLLYSCSSSTPQSISQKIEKGSKLSDDDYTVMLDYCINAVNETIKDVEGGDVPSLSELSDMSTLADRIFGGSMIDINEKHEYYNLFMDALRIQDEGSDKNKMKAQELIKALTKLNTSIIPTSIYGNE